MHAAVTVIHLIFYQSFFIKGLEQIPVSTIYHSLLRDTDHVHYELINFRIVTSASDGSMFLSSRHL